MFRRTALWETCMLPPLEEERTDPVLRGIWRWPWCVTEENRCFLMWWCCCRSLWLFVSGRGAGAEMREEDLWEGSRALGSHPCYKPVCSSRSLLCSEALHKTAQNAAANETKTWQMIKFELSCFHLTLRSSGQRLCNSPGPVPGPILHLVQSHVKYDAPVAIAISRPTQLSSSHPFLPPIPCCLNRKCTCVY